MDYQTLYLKTVVELRKLAKEMGVRIPAGSGKAIIINLLLNAYGARKDAEKENAAQAQKKPTAEEKTQEAQQDAPAPDEAEEEEPAAAPVMRMAAEPQVVDRRLPRQEYDREDVRGHTFYPSRSRYSQGDVRMPRQAAGFSRAERRQDMPQGRFAGRQEGFAAQNRYGVRGDQPDRQPRQGLRQDMPDGRTRCAPETPGRVSESPARPLRQEEPVFRYPCREYPRGEWEDGNIAPEGNPGSEYAQRSRREGLCGEEYRTGNPAVSEMLAAGECSEGSGILEIQPDGYGFLRAENYQEGPKDVYVSIAQIRRFGLRMGDHVVGKTRPQREGDRYTAMMYITGINGQKPEETGRRPRFDELIPVYPDERLRLEQPGENDMSLRIIDMLAPIGKGQRGLIVSPPKAGKTTLLKKLAHAITAAHPEIHLIVLLIDERPEEVTDMKRSIDGEVVYSTFDEAPENHTKVSEMVLERARRLVEQGKDVVVLMDSITRLARAYNIVIPPTGRSLSGGLDPGALHKPKRFFGAARNIENGGSLTVIATALVDTGSRMDDIIYEEFKGTGNMELHLDRKLSDRRVFPAVDMVRSGTRREELLLGEAELEGARRVRRMIAGGNDQEDAEQVMALVEKTTTNAEFFQRLNAWQSVYEKNGFSMGKDITK